ncbi:hypothetical protein JCM5350_001197 [Sporobolomyces pararoseus]
MQAVASASAGTLPPRDEQQRRRTPSSSSNQPEPSSSNSATSATPAVRLPPVTIPGDHFLPVAFNPERRQSINSDPFLHAFSATSDPSYLRRPSIDESSSLFSGNGGFQGPSQSAGGAERGSGMVAAGPSHSPPRAAMPPPPPSLHSFDSHTSYQFGTSFTPGPPGPLPSASSTSSQHPHSHPPPPDPHVHPHHPPFPGPTSAYRFGGPSLASPVAPLDPPSYFDYSMRRHSLTNNQSPNRYSNSAPQPLTSAATSNPSTKRKSSADDDESSFNDGSYYPPRSRDNSSMTGNPPPNSKRKTASVAATDKLNNLELSEGQRRESYSPTWEERRASDESYRSGGSQGSYSMFHPGQGSASGGTGNSSNQQQHPPPPAFMRPNHGSTTQFYDDQIGPRGSIARGMYEPEHQNFGRRPSIPGVSQMIQGQAPFYPHSAPPTAQQQPPPPPPPSLPRTASGSNQQPTVTVSSAPHPTDSHLPPNPPQSLTQTNGFQVGPPPQWPSSSNQGHNSRQGSAGSLDPNSGVKDSPYSRSPELRISHKLAERKRRKEMSGLFEELRNAIPVGEKGVKSSKWEILTNAVEFIAQLKAFNRDLQNDNQNLRHHLNLPQAQPPPHEMQPNRPHPLQPAPPQQHQYIDHSRPSSAQQQQQHVASPRPHPSRNGSHASSHTSSFSNDNGHPQQ